jgi:hypothetical protein
MDDSRSQQCLRNLRAVRSDERAQLIDDFTLRRLRIDHQSSDRQHDDEQRRNRFVRRRGHREAALHSSCCGLARAE